MTTTRIIGHTTLTLKQIAPSVSDAFSPNLHRWMRNKAHFYKGGGVRQTVYRVKPGTKLSKDIGADTLMIGYPERSYEYGFIGVRLISALCEGARAGSFYYMGMAAMLEEVEGFWDQYLKVGRCAIDPSHKEHFQDDRYSMEGETRTCLWCGAKPSLFAKDQSVFQ